MEHAFHGRGILSDRLLPVLPKRDTFSCFRLILKISHSAVCLQFV